MTEPSSDKRYTIEPFDPDKHDRTTFSCGVAQVDNFFQKTANKLSQAGNLRMFVMTAREGHVIGFYCVNAHSVDHAALPKRFERTRPGHGQIPAAFISMIGVDQRFSGKGYGGDLLIDCLTRIARASESLGIAVVMLDVLDCGDPTKVQRRKDLYAGYGFAPLSSNELRFYLPMKTVQAMIDGGDGKSGKPHSRR